MTDIPIIFSAPMILGLAREAEEEGTGKSMTSRMGWKSTVPSPGFPEGTMRATPWQNVKAGDRLWVRESLAYKLGMWWYVADGARVALEPQHAAAGTAWAHHYSRDSAPSIHMPRAISRFTLVITDTKLRRLQDITEVECEREGLVYQDSMWVCPHPELPGGWHATLEAKDCFMWLWRKLHGDGAWEENPEVVVLTFTVHKQNIDSLKQAA